MQSSLIIERVPDGSTVKQHRELRPSGRLYSTSRFPEVTGGRYRGATHLARKGTENPISEEDSSSRRYAEVQVWALIEANYHAAHL